LKPDANSEFNLCGSVDICGNANIHTKVLEWDAEFHTTPIAQVLPR
jgi:hypothetical protein